MKMNRNKSHLNQSSMMAAAKSKDLDEGNKIIASPVSGKCLLLYLLYDLYIFIYICY